MPAHHEERLALGSLLNTDPLFAPGIKRRKRAKGDACYWCAPVKDVQGGYSPALLPLPPSLTELEIAAECRKQWGRLEQWRNGGPVGPTRYTFAWLIDRYRTDEHSPYQKLRYKSRRNYDHCNNIIRAELDEVMIDRTRKRPIDGGDVWRWHKSWGSPTPIMRKDAAKKLPGKGRVYERVPVLDAEGKPVVKARPGRARHVITHLRILANYGVVIRCPGAKDLVEVLDAMEFPTTDARETAPTFENVIAIVNEAIRRGLRSMAITTLAQFEFIERRISIIGAWEGVKDKKTWGRGWVWSGVSGRTRVGISGDWVITYTQNKRGKVIREFDLKATPLLLKLLQEIPEDKRTGAVIVCETTGKPWMEKHYTDTFRVIARAAGVPDTVWSMDMRAGGATEADSITGITEDDLRPAGGWRSDSYRRYTRAPQRRAQNVVKLRQQGRENS
jgi:hypothetical protein